MKRTIVAILIGLFLTVLLFVLGALFSGGGHDLTAVTICFPYALITGLLTKDTQFDRVGGIASMALMAAQFPVYVILFAWVKQPRPRTAALTAIVILHVLATLIGLNVYKRSRPNYNFGAIQQIVGRERREPEYSDA